MGLRPRSYGPRLLVYTDGAICPRRGLSGLAAVVRDARGRVRFLWSRRAGPMSCNEVEYAAVLMALERLRPLGAHTVEVFCDSKLIVDQVQGRAAARAPGLRLAHSRLRALLSHFPRISFRHIPRRQNRLADALAAEALEGRGGGT